MMAETLNLIGGEDVPARSGASLASINPATGEAWATLPDSDAADVEAAVSAAKQAFAEWSGMGAAGRSRLMLRLADLIDAHLDELALMECMDTGKPLALARQVDIPRAAENLRFFATAILHDSSQATLFDRTGGPQGAAAGSGGALNYTLRCPRGVAGCISPWNLPLYLFTWKIAPALATGNTVVAKPSELTPATAFRLGQLTREAGFPPGALNIVHGTGAKVGAAIVAHPEVPTISFTGGTATGRAISSVASPMFKRLSLELGGKNANVVFADADFEKAVPTAVRASFTNQGEICLCGSRIYVQRERFEEFLERFLDETRMWRVGDPMQESTRVGALISAAHREKVASAVERARGLGARVHCGGAAPDPESLPQRCRRGFFYEPTVLTGLDPGCAVEQEEIFGPVVSITPFGSEEEAIALANGTPYGLAGMVWTQNVSRAHRVAGVLEAGVVWVNCWLVRDLRTPFGGMKQSGVGREGGWEALRFFTEARNVCVQM